MGSDHNKSKNKAKYAEYFDQKKHYKARLSVGSSNQNSKILNSLKEDKEEEKNSEVMIKSKTESKISETATKTNEEIEASKKARKVTIDGLKSLSSQNLVKIGKEGEASKSGSESEETSSNNLVQIKKEKKDLNTKELYEDYENDNSVGDDDDEGEEIKPQEKEVITEEEKKMVPNNIKQVFIDSRGNKNIINISHDNKVISEASTSEGQRNRSQSSIITANDYELNFYRNGTDIRQSYLTKLLQTKVWTPNMKPKKHNCLIIFDWDDTLLPTSVLTKGSTFYDDIQLSPSEQKKMEELENLVLELLNETIEKGSVYIITNAGKGWVEYSANKFYPKIVPILEKIKIVSARGEYEKEFPGNSRQWKIEAFLMLQNTVNMQLVTNIICLGDSLFEMEAGRILASKFSEAFIKTIKFREAPKLDELIKQLKLVCKQFNSIYLSIKNLTIRVERKKK